MFDIKHSEKEEVEEGMVKIEVTAEFKLPKKYQAFATKFEIRI